jgi:hypothetical protein
MIRILHTLLFATILFTNIQAKDLMDKPWAIGRLTVSENHRFLIAPNGKPFFWLGNTAWLLPERLNRDEVDFFLSKEQEAGFNVEQIQVLNAIPTFNIYGREANNADFDFREIEKNRNYGYWEHLDYIVDTADKYGIYIAMDCIWGAMVKSGTMNIEKAKAYGSFLGNRYKNKPNIIWLMGGDIRGDIHPEVWDALARAIKNADPNHLMTFHPRGRTTSASWFNDREWLDFNMFQSGHRRYGQRNGDGDYTIQENTEEDNWRYVELSQGMRIMKPVIDGEPSYEDIPQGLHDTNEPRWTDKDVRRYAYWSVFAGAFGHTYGHNSIMQMMRPGVKAAYGANKSWWEALDAPGRNEMKFLKMLILTFPFTERVPDQSIISGNNGQQYDRIIATRGKDYLLVYNYSGKPMRIDLRKISGEKKNAWWMNPQNGSLKYIGTFENEVTDFTTDKDFCNNPDCVLIATDVVANYIATTTRFIR